jgi:hypothetical protein
VRKKLKEYTEAGIIVTEKVGRKVSYSRSEDADVKDLNEVLHFYSEVAPCGVIGSFILEKEELDTDAFTFKHHYITGAIDSGVLASIFTAMREKKIISVSNLSRRKDTPRRNRIIPLRVFISVQSGRQHLLAYLPGYNNFQSYRIDYLSNIKLEEETPRFDELRAQIDEMKDKMWGVSTKRNKWGIEKLEHVDFTVKVADDEAHIIRRLEREKRVGKVEKIDDNTYELLAFEFGNRFKVVYGNWAVEFGAPTPETVWEINKEYTLAFKGSDFNAIDNKHKFEDCTIRLVVDYENAVVKITIMSETLPSAVEDVVVPNTTTKVIENGQMFIIRDGVRYNALGVVVK